MAKQLDYAVRNNNSSGSSQKKKNSNGINKFLLILITAFIVTGFAVTLYLLKENGQEQDIPQNTEKNQPKSQLPSRPEEVWSYIKELESRTVVTDDTKKAQSIELTEKQKEELLRLEEREKQAALDKAMERLIQEESKKDDIPQAAQYVPKKDYAALKAEEARKVAEQKKIAEAKKAAELKKAEEAKKIAVAEEAKKTDTVKETKQTDTVKPAGGKFGLQCGAFKNKEQADALQSRLNKIGLNARVNASADWNRVVVGPMNDRAAAVTTRQQAASVINCVVIAM